MELSNVGATCALSSCRQRDFLPFSCTNCHQKFCLDHRTPASHHCFALEASSANTAECPVCGQVVIARSGESLDLAVATHMDAGCKKTTVVAQKCLVPSCKNHDVLRLKCDGCGRISCVAHRSPDLHDCPSIKQAAAPNNSNNNSVLPPVAASRVGNRVRALMSSLHKKKKTNSSAMVMRQTAEGDAKLAVERRWFAEVHFGLGSGKSKWVFLNSSFSVGKSIDVLAQMGGVTNNNDKKGVAKLFLFDLSTGLPLSNLTLLRDLPSGQMVLLLDTEASVFEESTN